MFGGFGWFKGVLGGGMMMGGWMVGDEEDRE